MFIEIDLESIKSGLHGISPAWGSLMSEACMVCLCRSNHTSGVAISVDAGDTTYFSLKWSGSMTPQIDRSWRDQEETTEFGAVCLGVQLVLKLTQYTIIERSAKTTGFDYWLAQENEEGLSFDNKARLEISGIFKGDASKVEGRYNRKMKQTEQSSTLSIPAYVAIIEFSNPMAKFTNCI